MRKNCDGKSIHSEEIILIFQNNEQPSKRRKREIKHSEIAASPKIEYWLNIINSNKTLIQ